MSSDEESPLANSNEVTEDIRRTLCWMVEDMKFRREQTGLDGDPVSHEMQIALKLLDDLRAGKIECRRIP